MITIKFLSCLTWSFVLKIINEYLVPLETKKKIVIYQINAHEHILYLWWLDTVFQGQYLPGLSINYVAINKDVEKLTPQLY